MRNRPKTKDQRQKTASSDCRLQIGVRQTNLPSVYGLWSSVFSLKRGFTLIELMIVVIIIAALAAMVVPRLSGRSEQARISIAQSDISANIGTALKLYELDNGNFPTTEQGLNALLSKPSSNPAPLNWRGPYLERKPIDPWKNPYQYKCPGTHNPSTYDLYSLGKDAQEGTADDIGNWE